MHELIDDLRQETVSQLVGCYVDSAKEDSELIVGVTPVRLLATVNTSGRRDGRIAL